MRSRQFCALCFIALTAASLADEPEPPKPLEDRVDELTADYRSTRPFAALAVGVIHDGHREVFSFGEITSGDKKLPVDGRTIFEIGSCTKVFTSLSLAVVVARGDVKLDDPIGPLLPGVSLSPDAAAITLKQLSTHTSGLPRIPIGMYVDAIVKSNNPYRDFTPARLLDSLREWKRPEKITNSYSNLGAGLLGYVLQQHEHAPDFQSLIRSTITEPLKMPDTVAALSDEQRARYATGFDVKGKPLENWDFDALSGAGALRSSAADLLTFLDNQLHPDRSPLEDAIELAQQEHYDGKPGRMGLGWQIAKPDGRSAHWHNGATGAYRSFFAFDRVAGVAVVLLSNTGDAYGGDARIDQMGIELMKLLEAAPERKP